ncbi:transposase [Ktedonobacteria bacterium brp13]|nr:transposase [Ktedonobacteria bacterium brp13]BCL80875.1 transposase [Ktedonobacteria bacterium brp13]
MKQQDTSSFPSAEELWTAEFQDVCERIGPSFARSETRKRAQIYLQGLLSPIERKNGWQLAEEAGESTPYAMQYLLDRAVWDAEHVRDVLRAYVRETIGEAAGMLVIDETGFLKKGVKSVGVQRQYSGTAGRIENCQVGVFLSYACSHGHTLLDRALYLPKSWTNDQKRCQQADVPAEVGFATKPVLAARMLWRTLDGGVKASFVLGDSVYGSHRPLREGLEARWQAYALAVACKEKVEVAGTRKRVDQVARTLSTMDWQRLSAGDGSKGPRLFDWAWVEIVGPQKQGWKRWLVVRRSLTEGAKPADLAYFLVFAPAATTLWEMVSAIGSRWTVEQCFEEAKGEVGLDEYEVRSFHGWYRHITLSMLAHAFLTILRAHSQVDLPQGEENEEKKEWKPFLSHAPSQTLSGFKRQRGLAC